MEVVLLLRPLPDFSNSSMLGLLSGYGGRGLGLAFLDMVLSFYKLFHLPLGGLLSRSPPDGFPVVLGHPAP